MKAGTLVVHGWHAGVARHYFRLSQSLADAMSEGPVLCPSVLAAKLALQEGQLKLREQHLQGSPGIQVCAKLTDLTDTVVTDIFERAISDLIELDPTFFGTLPDHVALAAHGGYGRRELAPYSDLDLMILHNSEVSDRIAVLAERLMRDICDTGLILGQSVRTPTQAVSLALRDPLVLTSLTESRHLVGNQEITDRFVHRLKRATARRARSLLRVIDETRRQERRQYGETVFLLEPNIKRSRGGLRDIQLLRWIGFCLYGTTDPNSLYLKGVLEKEEQQVLRSAAEFLLRTRNESHFQAGKPHDQLDRAEQVRIAEQFGYQGAEGLRPVEQFMQDYFRHTRAVRYISARFLANAYRRSRVAGWFAALLSHRVENDFWVGPFSIAATNQGMKRIRTDLNEVLRLAELATLYDKRITHDTWEAVRDAATRCHEVSTETASRFVSLLSRPPQLARILWRLHELGVLEKMIPAFSRARGMLQFNDYHKYTVDEHCLLAVRRATEFAQDDGPLGDVYTAIEQKEILHLALLIHDLGKGYVEDHSDVGRRIARETAVHLRLPPHETELLEFLVYKHLLMSRWALWHDINDPAVMQRFVVEVGSPEILRMLYVLTAADLAAVGPGVLNHWKIEVLTQFYQRALEHLTGDGPITSDEEWADMRRTEVRNLMGEDAEASDDLIDSLPITYLRGTPSEQIADALVRLQKLQPLDVVAWGVYREDRGVTEFTVAAHESIVSGAFYRLAGALSSEGIEILSAQINTLNDGWILDRFHVIDNQYQALPTTLRVEEVCASLVSALKSPQTEPPKIRRIWGGTTDKAILSGMQTRVLYDNMTSNRATIMQIFAPDRPGLLYTVAKKLHDLGLSILAAKIGTHLDQVVDIFYVVDVAGTKVSDEDRLQSIREQLLKTIELFEADYQAVI